MAEKKKTTKKTAKKSAAKSRVEQAGERIREGADRLRSAGETVRESQSEIAMKMIDHAEANTKSVFAALRRAAGAKDLGEVMKVQGEYLREQGERSMDHAREIGEMIGEFGRDAVSELRGGKE